MTRSQGNDKALALLTGTETWDEALCLGKPERFCPSEDDMTHEWARKEAVLAAAECLSCPVFEQCKGLLISEMNDPKVSPTGVMAGVVLHKSRSQIESALKRVDALRAEADEAEAEAHRSKSDPEKARSRVLAKALLPNTATNRPWAS